MSIALEKEIKFRIDSWEEGERRLASAGAALREPRCFERNSLFDTSGQKLEKRGEALRLRRAGEQAWLTYKGPVHGTGRIKQRKEYETSLDDAQAVEEIFRILGLMETFRYEKYRAVFEIGNLKLSLDETPMGFFMELEGSAEEIETAARKMEFPMEASVSLTYPRLYQLYRDQTQRAPEFMVFPEDNRPR